MVLSSTCTLLNPWHLAGDSPGWSAYVDHLRRPIDLPILRPPCARHVMSLMLENPLLFPTRA